MIEEMKNVLIAGLAVIFCSCEVSLGREVVKPYEMVRTPLYF